MPSKPGPREIPRQASRELDLVRTAKEVKKTYGPNSVEEITVTSQRLCEDYIHARLRRSGISDFDIASNLAQTDCSLMLQSMGQILELRYPKLFSQISVHLRLTYSNEAVVWGAFNKFASHLFIDGITWARVVALYAFAGGLAVDCAAHGRAIFLGRIGYWLASFVAKHLAKWIQQRDGWAGFVNHFSKRQMAPEPRIDDNKTHPFKRIFSWVTPAVSYAALVTLTSSVVVAAATFFAIASYEQNKG